MATLTIHALRKGYAECLALDRVSLTVADGEFVVLVGPSGCGKSTLLRLVAGLEDPDDGDILLDGVSILGLAPGRRDIAMVFQNYALYPHMTVASNLAFPLKMHRLDKSEIQRRVTEVAQILGISELLHRKARHLSGGQQQRVALGRAMVRQPRLFLFDEPLSNLDARLRAVMRTELKALHQRLGATMLYVTHDQVEAMSLAHRLAVLDRGRLQQVGEPARVYGRPANLFVAGFLGNPPMNLLPIQVREGVVVLPGGATVDRSLFARHRLPAGDLVLGVRPEDVVPAEAADRQMAVVAAQVTLVEPLGAETILRCRLGETDFAVRFAGGPAAAPGEHRRFAFAPERVHFFLAADGRRLAGIEEEEH